MDPSRQDFIDATLGYRVDPASRVMVEQAVALASQIPGPANSDPAGVAAASMRSVAARPRAVRKLPFIVALAAAALAAFVLLVGPPALRELRDIADSNCASLDFEMNEHFSIPSQSVPIPFLSVQSDRERHNVRIERAFAHVPDDRRALLRSTLRPKDYVAHWERLARGPEGNAEFLELWESSALAVSRDGVPNSYLETAERLDPGNGYYPLMVASWKLYNLMRYERSRFPVRSGGNQWTLRMEDRAEFLECWRMIAEALEMPSFEMPFRALAESRLAALPVARDYPDQCRRLGFQVSIYYQMQSGIQWYNLASGFRLRCRMALEEGDTEELERLRKLGRQMVRVMVRDRALGTVSAVLVARALASESTEGFAPGFDDRDAEATSREMERVRGYPGFGDALVEKRHTSYAGHLVSARVVGSAPVRDEEVRGGRLAERRMYDRLLVHFGGGLLVIAAVFLLAVPVLSKTPLWLLLRFAGLLSWRDHVAMIGLGVLLPVALYAVCAWVPETMSRDVALGGTEFMMRVVQMGALVLAILSGMRQVAQWKLGRRGAVAGFGWFGRDPGWAVWIVSLAAMPSVAAAGRWLPVFPWWGLWAVAGLLLLPLGWMLLMASALLFGKQERRLHRLTVSLAMAPQVSLAALLLAGCLPWLHAEERAWVATIRFEDPANPDGYRRLQRELEEAEKRNVLSLIGETPESAGIPPVE